MARTTSLLTALALSAAGLLLTVTATVAPATASAATAASCGGVTLTPASRTVRRGGQVLLEGQSCGASAAAGGAEAVQLKIRKGKKWATLASAQPSEDGSFSVCASVRVPKKVRVARVQATSTSGASGSTTLRVAPRGASGCEAGDGSESTDTADGSDSGSGSGGGYQPPAGGGGNPDCPINQPDSTLGLTVPSSCTAVWSDNASASNPTALWGAIDAVSSSRHQLVSSGGDSRPTGLGSSQGNGSFRRMTVYDGDDFYGERAELGFNNWSGPTALYHEGERRVTFISLRVPDVNGDYWKTVMQMKQAQGYRNPNQSPVLEMQVFDGQWKIQNSWNNVWSAPAQANTWTRFGFDVTYSQDPDVGSIKVYVDLNGDGDASDSGEQSPRIHTATLRAETAGTGYSDYEVGESIASHLRAGIYHHPNYNCSSGCSVDVDNVQVVQG